MSKWTKGFAFGLMVMVIVNIVPMVANAYQYQVPGRIYGLSVDKRNTYVTMGTYKSGANYYGVDVTASKLEAANTNHALWVGIYERSGKNTYKLFEKTRNFRNVAQSATYDVDENIDNRYRTFEVRMSTDSSKTNATTERNMSVNATFWTIQY